VSTRDPRQQDGGGWTRFAWLRWLTSPENPALAHQAVLRLTYGIIPLIMVASLATPLLGMAAPMWLIAGLGAVLLGATWRQEHLLARGVFSIWMPIAHLNLTMLLLSVWVAYAGSLTGPFVWMYAGPIAIHGVLWGSRWALATAALSTGYLLALFAMTRAGIGIFTTDVPPSLVMPLYLISYIGMFFIVAVFSGQLRHHARVVLQLAHTDPLTGLPNRRALLDVLEREVARTRRYGHPCTVLVLELDHFKQVNDRFGHLAGDEALRRVAASLTGSCRSSDVIARFGGDEFIVVMPETGADAGLAVARRICRDVEEFTLLRGMHLTLSGGLAECPTHGLTAQQVLDAADRAMYEVKRRGGNGAEGASPLVAAGSVP
jgi:diguanylate cyclase (GGDEF)-like protein